MINKLDQLMVGIHGHLSMNLMRASIYHQTKYRAYYHNADFRYMFDMYHRGNRNYRHNDKAKYFKNIYKSLKRNKEIKYLSTNSKYK